MTEKKKAAEAAQLTDVTNVHNPKDLAKVFEYFRYKVGTSLDAMLATGILRSSITWYIAQLEDAGLLQAIYIAKDKHTGFRAKHYSADTAKWPKTPLNKKPNLAREEVQTWD